MLISRGGAKYSTSHSSLSAAISASSSSSSSSSRRFLIGGAQLYNDSLTSSPPLVNRVLLTRITGSHSGDIECDTFLEDFVSHTQSDGSKAWRLASHKELQEYIGFECQEGEVEEKGYRYRFELWERA